MRVGDTPSRLEQGRWGWLILFSSSSTLICCALPILLVTLGMGAVSASVFATFPFLVELAQHKTWMFTGSGLLLALSGWFLFRGGRVCPADQRLAEQCEKAHLWNVRLWWASIAVWFIGFAAAYLALPVWEYFEA